MIKNKKYIFELSKYLQKYWYRIMPMLILSKLWHGLFLFTWVHFLSLHCIQWLCYMYNSKYGISLYTNSYNQPLYFNQDHSLIIPASSS